jgi:hypothetical protein
MNSNAPEVLAVPDPLAIPVVLLLNDTNIIGYGNRVGHQYYVNKFKYHKKKLNKA